eukprot:TRINITY_DN1773_c0_g1_i1.p1 TRINITY_DN1773_c0_g1~~TRINITY_DN1773_c0_g1_i1.p1  ORF type:complete len:312 (+),score=67.54 TRINITY_DN1773_c0_g1_i1:520-1455(+)
MLGNLLFAPIFYIALHFYTRTRMGVINDAPVAAEARKGLIPVLISHGYSNDHLSMTVIAKELASQGYLVICVDHRNEWTKEELSVKIKVQQVFWEYVKESVKKRPSELKTVIDTFTRTLPKRLPSDAPVQIDWTKAVGIGHSIGGDAIMRSIIGGLKLASCVVLDTYMYLDAAQKEKGLSVPLLFLQAEQTLISFGKDPALKDVEELISHSSKEVKEKSTFIVLKGQNHVSPTDVALLTPGELFYLSKWGMSIPSDVIPLYEIQNTLIVEFLERTIQKNASGLKSEDTLGNTLRSLVKKTLSLEDKVLVRF